MSSRDEMAISGCFRMLREQDMTMCELNLWLDDEVVDVYAVLACLFWDGISTIARARERSCNVCNEMERCHRFITCLHAGVTVKVILNM